MIKTIVKDMFFLNQKSDIATEEDHQVIIDLLDTLKANQAGCVGLAANMIGVKKRIIVINMNGDHVAMINPELKNMADPYETEEGCLSLTGVRKTKRYNKIEVAYLDSKFKRRTKKYNGWIAQIIQHEIDHCNGIII